MDRLIPAPLCLAAGAGAGTAFGFGPQALHVAIIVPFVMAPGRGAVSVATAVAATSAATLPAGLAAFDYTDLIATSLIAWAVPAGVTGLAFGAALAAPRAWRPLAVGTAILAVSLPPLGSISLVSPLPIAGLLYPGSGLFGIALVVVLLAALSVRRSDLATTVSVLCLVTAAALIAHAVSEPAQGRAQVVGVDTHRGQPDAETSALLSGVWRREERRASELLGASTVLWPESVYGEWTELTGAMLTLTATTVIGGARHYVAENAYVNTLVDGKSGEVLYAQRSPVPLPIDGRARAVSVVSLEEPGLVHHDDLHALLCIEIAHPWLAISTFRAAALDKRRSGAGIVSAEPVMWAANLGWSTRPGLERRMRQTALQWSRLFDVPLVTAINRAEVPGA